MKPKAATLIKFKEKYIQISMVIITLVMTILRFLLNEKGRTNPDSISGIICSYFIQYFYSVNTIDYRLMAPFSFPIWLVYFKKLFEIFDIKVYAIGFLSLMTGMTFTWLSKGNYLENRKEMTQFLQSENLDKVPLKFYLEKEEDLEKIQIAELINTINPQVRITFKPKDSLQKTTLTRYKVLQKIKIDKNKYQ